MYDVTHWNDRGAFIGHKLIDEKIQEDETSVALLSKETGDSTIYLLINPSTEKEYVYDVPEALQNYKPVAELAVEGNSTYRNGKVYLAKGGIVIFTQVK